MLPEFLALAESALGVARHGLPIFPLWWPRNGGCACRAGLDCRQPGKHPRILGWQTEATTDETKIREWWSKWPTANIGIVTGRYADRALPGLMVLDVDAAGGGLESLAALEACHGPLPETVEVITGKGDLDGRRGRHIYFRYPDATIGNSVRKLGPGLDVRGDGGLVVAAGSHHASGLTYEWEIAHHPEETPLLEPPHWLLDMLVLGVRPVPIFSNGPWSEPEGLPPVAARIDRARSWLVNRAPAVQGNGGSSHTMGMCAVVTRGFALENDDDALEAMADWNGRCVPPWDERANAPAADSLLRKVREGRSKGHIIGIGEKLMPPRRVFFGGQLPREDERASTGEPGGASSDHEDGPRILAITGSSGELPHLLRASELALRAQPIYAFGGNLVTVRDGEGGPSLLLTHKDYLRVLLNGVLGFAKPHGKEYRECWPPDEVLGGLLNKGRWELPTITGIVEAPTMRPDGSILDRPGFDSASGLMFVSGSQAWETVPDEPTPEDLQIALRWLEEPFLDFPFEAEHHRAAAIAALITAVARPAIAGPVPMFLFDATTPGTGKGMLANIVSLVATGRRAPVIPPPNDDEEMQKLITALALQGARIVIFDNVAKALGGASLDAAITSSWWQGRILGANRTFDGPLRPFWGATGNNLQLRGDMHRRVVPVRMETTVEDPESRQDFVHPDLLGWVRENRARLVLSALTVLRAYQVAGRPRPDGLSRFGGFEQWDDVVRAALVWSGVPDVLEGRRELRQQDPETLSFRTVLDAWYRLFANQQRTLQAARRSINDATDGDAGALRDALIELAPTKDGKDWDLSRVRYYFRRYQGRKFGELRLLVGDRDKAGMRWRVEGTTT